MFSFDEIPFVNICFCCLNLECLLFLKKKFFFISMSFSCIRNITNVGICASHWVTSSSCLIWLQSWWQEKACLEKWAVDTWIRSCLREVSNRNVHVSEKWAVDTFKSQRRERWIHSCLGEVSCGNVHAKEVLMTVLFLKWWDLKMLFPELFPNSQPLKLHHFAKWGSFVSMIAQWREVTSPF